MPYWGKVVGLVSGLATGKAILALIGLVLGHQFDRGFANARDRQGAAFGADRLPAIFPQILFEVAGCLAKADGRVSEDEIRAARALMHRLGLGPAGIRDAIDGFERGKQPDYPLDSSLRRLREATARRPELRPLFVRLLLEVALGKRSLHKRERAVIWSICRELGISRVELAQLEAMLRAQKAFRRSAAGGADAERVSGAYAVLGVREQSTNAEIKQAYRRLMNRYHPDKLSRALDPATLRAAEQRTREIRGAYDMLKARRSIR